MAHAEPVGGSLLTRPMRWLLAFIGLWTLLLAWRFAAGIGEVSGLTDISNQLFAANGTRLRLAVWSVQTVPRAILSGR